MNQKKAKSIRRTMRRLFGREVETDQRFHHHGFHERHLHKHCGRAEYQRLKRAEKDLRRKGESTLGPSRHYFPAALDAQREAHERAAA